MHVHCSSSSLKLGQTSMQVTRIVIHPSINQPPTPTVSEPSHSLPFPYVFRVRAKWHCLLQQIHCSLKRLLARFFSSTWPSLSTSFYPLSHTYSHILRLLVNSCTQSHALSFYVCSPLSSFNFNAGCIACDTIVAWLSSGPLLIF